MSTGKMGHVAETELLIIHGRFKKNPLIEKCSLMGPGGKQINCFFPPNGQIRIQNE